MRLDSIPIAGRTGPIRWPAWMESPRPWVFALAALGIVIVPFLFGERVQVHGGLGWDGVTYARWARDFHTEIFVNKVDTYYVQRILPSAVVHYSLRLLGIPLTDGHIIRAFGAMNVALLVLTGWFWGLVAQQLRISAVGRWLGFAGLFLNYIIVKHTFFYPVLTDTWAYAFGLLMVHAYLAGRPLTLLGLTLVGAFVWPLTLYIGPLLILFPRSESNSGTIPPRIPWHIVAAGIGAVAVAFGIRAVLHAGPATMHGLIETQYVEPIRSVLKLSIFVAAAYLFFAAAALLRSAPLFDLRTYLTPRRILIGVGLLALVLGIKQIQHDVSNGRHFMGLSEMLAMTAYAAVAKPGVFLVTHSVYYGPIFLLAVFLWRPVCRQIHAHGVGLTLAIFIGVALSLNSQSRYFLNIFTILVPFVVKAIDELAWRPAQYYLIAGIGLFSSKCWLTINAAGPFHGRLLEFPDQLLFMSHGPWISTEMYLVQGAAIIVFGSIIYVCCIRRTGADGASAGAPAELPMTQAMPTRRAG